MCALAITASSAHADLRPGTTNSILRGGELAMPLPAVKLPKLVVHRTAANRLRVRVRVRYEAANWRGSGRALRDRALITLSVARRWETTGPDPSRPVFSRRIVHRLKQRKVGRTYELTLSRRASKLLRRKGALSTRERRRAHGLRLLWVDVQQDRDYRRVDGRYDWREGTAWGAADGLRRRLGRSPAHARSSYRNPTGTLTLVNNTASGVYCDGLECPLVDQATALPGSEAGTTNNPDYQVDLAVGGDAVQCFDQGSNGSNPAGFANYDASGDPQPYVPGTVSPGNAESVIPNTTGTAVTQGLAADYTLAWASSNQVADTSGFISGEVKLGFQLIKGAAGGFVSPGAVITSVLGIFEFFLENSCKEQGNYFNVTASEPAGGTVSSTIDAANEVWFPYAGTGSTPYGTQFNPSTIGYAGAPVYLNAVGASTPGLADNACDGCSSDNVVALSWAGYDPCPDGYNCAARPPASPQVSSDTGDVDCKDGNVACPFPAAGWPSPPSSVPVFVGISNGVLWRCDAVNVTSCTTFDNAGKNDVAALDSGGGSLWAGISNGVLWKCSVAFANDCFTLDQAGSSNGINAVLYANGTVYAGISNGVLWSCPTDAANACTNLDDAGGASVNALAYGDGAVYAGLANGILWRCDPAVVNTCQNLDNAGGNEINALEFGGGALFAGIGNGVIWECSPDVGNACEELGASTGSITSLVYEGGYLYAGATFTGDETGYVLRCTPGAPGSCQQWDPGSAQDLLAADGALFSASGITLSRCSTSTPSSCRQLDQTSLSKYKLLSLAAP